jgi:hypothetical protein
MTRSRCQSIILLVTALLYLPSYAIAIGPPTVLTFEGINTGPMPPGYGGVNWASNMGVWSDDQPPFNPQSPPTRVLFNQNGEFGVAESLVSFIGGPKIFDGAYFSGLNTVQFKLYSAATLVGTSGTLNLGNGTGPTFLTSGYAGPVDSVGIVGTRGQLAMDNFTFENVPEPSTILLLGMGAISLFGYRKAKSHGQSR